MSSFGAEVDDLAADAQSAQATHVAMKWSGHVVCIHSAEEDLVEFFRPANRSRRYDRF